MKYGYFDDQNKEYVITTPKTPLPWINYLGCEEFFTMISNTGGGYSFYKDAKLLRLTRFRYNNTPKDSNGHYFYIKDGDTIWNPGWQPTQTPLDDYKTRHGIGYSVLYGEKNKIAATQFPDGSAYHQYQPLTKRGNLDVGSGFNDDPLWLIAGVSAYIRETGDYSILDEITPFDNDDALAAPLMEHLNRSFNYTATHKGPHGLPLIGRADWNDCLNLNCFSDEPGESFQTTGPSEGPVAESVFIAGMFVKYGKEYVEILKHHGDTGLIEAAEKEIAEMEKTVLTAGWDGKWFLRAYDAFSEKVGSHECEDGQIFIEPQGFCVMAGIGKETGEAATALKSVEEKLESEYGIMILQPAYKEYHLNLGEVSSYPPGYKENAGIFCHNNPWVSIAETELGHGNRAYSIYKKITPSFLEDKGEIHRTEPYAYCQMVAGRDAQNFGEGKNSWLTGTASWTFINASQYILGVYPDFDGLRMRPCIPSDWKEFSVRRVFRGAVYNITVKNPDGLEGGNVAVTVNGEPIEGSVIPPQPKGSEVEVTVVIEK